MPSDGQHNYVIYSLSANVEDFRMAFLLNKKIGIHLQRDENLLVYSNDKEEPATFSFFHFSRNKQTCFFLIHNLGELQPLIKNYFLLINGFFTENDKNELVRVVEEIPELLSVNPLEITASQAVKKSMKKTIELINSIITDLEYHTLEVTRKNNEGLVQLRLSDAHSIKKLY